MHKDYHVSMHRLMLIVMIFLLPLRAWAGDTMATQMANPTGKVGVIAIETVAADANFKSDAADFDHHDQVQPKCHESADLAAHSSSIAGDTPESNPCQTCVACQACHTLALSPSTDGNALPFAQPALRPEPLAAFTSADAALGQKPPIS